MSYCRQEKSKGLVPEVLLPGKLWSPGVPPGEALGLAALHWQQVQQLVATEHPSWLQGLWALRPSTGTDLRAPSRPSRQETQDTEASRRGHQPALGCNEVSGTGIGPLQLLAVGPGGGDREWVQLGGG